MEDFNIICYNGQTGHNCISRHASIVKTLLPQQPNGGALKAYFDEVEEKRNLQVCSSWILKPDTISWDLKPTERRDSNYD